MSLEVLPRNLLEILLKIIQWQGFEKHFGYPYRATRNHLKALGRQWPEKGYITSLIFDEQSLERLRLKPPPNQEKEVEEILKILAREFKDVDPVRLGYLGYAARGLNKNKIEGSSESTGTIINSPYLHPGMIHLARRIPDRLFRPNEKTRSSVTGKYILMKMAEQKNLLPKEIIYQIKKTPLVSSVDTWYSGPLKSFMIQLMNDLPFKYNKSYINDLLRPTIAEKLYKKFLTRNYYTSHSIALLATYASFTKFSKKNG